MNTFIERVHQKGSTLTSREAQRRETVENVLVGAGELFRTRGFAATTVRDIATACGVSIGTAMSVGDKESLLIADFERRIAQIHASRPVPEHGSTPAREALLELLDPFLELFTAHPALSRAYGAVLVSGKHESTVFTELAGALRNEISRVLRSTGLSATRASVLAESIYFTYIGRLFTWTGDRPEDAPGLRTDLHRLISAICEDREPVR